VNTIISNRKINEDRKQKARAKHKQLQEGGIHVTDGLDYRNINREPIHFYIDCIYLFLYKHKKPEGFKKDRKYQFQKGIGQDEEAEDNKAD